MKLLLCHPGASFSTADVYTGLRAGMERMGVELVHYAMDGRVDVAGSWLMHSWRKGGKREVKPSPADIVYQASTGIIERALRHQVDWVLIISAMYIHPDALILLRRAGVRVAILFTESPYDDDWQLKYAGIGNVCWVNERASVERFRAAGHECYYWQHAIDPARHDTSGDDEALPAHDVVFVGTGFQERIETLAAVDWDGIDLGLYGSWSLLGSRHRLRRHLCGGVVPNHMTAGLYRRAKIGLNLHRQSIGFGREAPRIEHAESMNPRCYELAACGRFFLSDYRAEMRDVFGDLVPTFTTPDELETLTRHYLAHDAERERIAARLPAMVVDHNFYERARSMVRVLSQETAASLHL